MKQVKSKALYITGSIIAILVVVWYCGGHGTSTSNAVATSTNAIPVTAASSLENYPTLSLPLSYFSLKEVVSGSADAAYESDINNNVSNPRVGYTSATLDTSDDAQSYPTTTISFSGYSTSTISLPPIQTPTQIETQDAYDGEFKDLFQQNIAQYGSLATRYLPDEFIGSEASFPVEGGGQKATVITLCDVGSADGECGEAQIIMGNQVIFDAQSDYVDITPSETSNGFYVHSENDILEPSRANTLGYVKTRFVYTNGTFKPIYEQNVYYLNVQNSSDVSQ